jgi:hypothetical protein
MHNQNVNTVRQGIRETAVVDIEQVSATLAAPTDASGRGEMLELQRALARLPSTQRQVILLVGLEGMSYEESAGILGIPIGTVRSRLSRGRDDLRKFLGMEERRSLAARPDARHSGVGSAAYFATERHEPLVTANAEVVMRPVLLWALGIPIPVIILLYVFHVL